jgi:hypothetical protein
LIETVFPATVTVPVRAELPEFSSTATINEPLPESPDTLPTVSQDAVVVAVQPHPNRGFVVTVNKADDMPLATVRVAGVTE